MNLKDKFIRIRKSRLYGFIKAVRKECVHDKCLIRASSLSYSSLLAIVPLSALVFALFTAFGAFDQVKEEVQDFIIKMLIPTMSRDFLNYINSFVNNSKTLGIAGLMVFALTSILLLDSVSENFNAVWGSSNRRSFLAKFTSYSSVIVFGTLFIGASFMISAPIHSVLQRYPEAIFLLRWIMQLLPSVFIFITFMLMISAIPAGKVDLRSSALGALCGTVLWDISRWTFINGTNYALRMSIIYGSLAAIPIFLLWLYIIWLIILGSLEITYVHQHKKYLMTKYGKREIPPAGQILIGFELYIKVVRNFVNGKKPFSVSGIAYAFAISLNECEHYLGIFSSCGLLYISSDKKKILPPSDPSTVPVESVLKPLVGMPETPPDMENVSARIIENFISAGFSSLKDITIGDLIQAEGIRENR